MEYPHSDEAPGGLVSTTSALDLFLSAASCGRSINLTARLVPLGETTGLLLTGIGDPDASLIAGPDALDRLSAVLRQALEE